MSRAGEKGAPVEEDSKDISAAASTLDEVSTPPPIQQINDRVEDTNPPLIPDGDSLPIESFDSTGAEANVAPRIDKTSDEPSVAKEEAGQGEIEMKEESKDEIAETDEKEQKLSNGDLTALTALADEPMKVAYTAVENSDTTNHSNEKMTGLPVGNNSSVVATDAANSADEDQGKATVSISTEFSRPMDANTNEEDVSALASTSKAPPTKDGLDPEAINEAENHEEILNTEKAPTEAIDAIAETSSTAAKRNSAPLSLAETQQRARQDESLRIQKENEDMRLQWLSLPANDHITYYSDTEDDASSDQSDAKGLAPIGAFGGMPFLSGSNTRFSGNRKRNRQLFEEEKESSDSDDENMDQETMREEFQYKTGNRGNKLSKNSRWIRRGKLGLWTEAKTEKDYHDRFMRRIKAIQRAGVESILQNAPGPKVIQEDGAISKDMLDGSDRLLLRDINKPIIMKDSLYSTSLAPALLRPILSARALLESHTLRHTFRNPHIGALSKTALDLRESESQLAKALGRCFAAMERTSSYTEESEKGQLRVNGSQSTEGEIDIHIIGAENTAGTADEVNPALFRLEDLFITKKGLPIPVTSPEGEPQALEPGESQAILSTTDQRNVVRAALECLTDLAADSLEYVERLEEVRGRLESAKRQRTHVWEALRHWAIKREFGDEKVDDEAAAVEEETNGAESIVSRPGGSNKPNTAVNTASSGGGNKKRR